MKLRITEGLQDKQYRYYVLRRDRGSDVYTVEEFYDEDISLRTVKEDARRYYESDRRYLHGTAPEYWAYDVVRNKAYLPARFTEEDQVFDYTLPIVRPSGEVVEGISRKNEGLSNSLEIKLQDFAQEYGEIDYSDISNLSKCWELLSSDKKKKIQNLLSSIRKACKETGLDSYELSCEYPEDKKNCDELVSLIKDCNVSESITRHRRCKKMKEGYEGYHTISYIESDGELYEDEIFGNFTVEEYYDEETDEILGWTWSSSDDFEPTQPYFDTAEEAYKDAEYVFTPDDGSELVID